MRTAAEIQTEIAALKACKTYAPRRSAFGDDNHGQIDLQIQVLEDDIFEEDSAEWDELSGSEQDAIQEAKSWLADGNEEAGTPSSGWDAHKPKK